MVRIMFGKGSTAGLGTYHLSELDDTQLKKVYVGYRLTRFFQRERIEFDAVEDAADHGLAREVQEETENEINT